MARILLLLILQGYCLGILKAQSFTVDDLVTLSDLSFKRFDNYMHGKGYMAGGKRLQDDAMAFTFFEKQKRNPKDTVIESRSVDLYKKDNEYCFAFHTTSLQEYRLGISRLKSSNFFTGEKMDSTQASYFFQRKNLRVHVSSASEDGIPVYTFLLKKKDLGGSVNFAEDLLRFDSHQYLLSYFGEKNVQKDICYVSEKKSRKCSVLFGNSNRQVVFVWEDENNLCKLSYILISGVIPTENALPFTENIGRNIWEFKSGVYSGMTLRDLLLLNGSDFRFYGFDSEYSMLIEPVNTGNLDFSKMGILLTSLDGDGPPLLRRGKVSAEHAIENRIALHVFYIMLSP